MQPITFPDDAITVGENPTQSAEPQKAVHKSPHSTPGEGCIQYGECQEILFTTPGKFHTDHKVAFNHPLPEGHVETGTTLVASPAVSQKAEITLFFDVDNGPKKKFHLSVQQQC